MFAICVCQSTTEFLFLPKSPDDDDDNQSFRYGFHKSMMPLSMMVGKKQTNLAMVMPMMAVVVFVFPYGLIEDAYGA